MHCEPDHTRDLELCLKPDLNARNYVVLNACDASACFVLSCSLRCETSAGVGEVVCTVSQGFQGDDDTWPYP